MEQFLNKYREQNKSVAAIIKHSKSYTKSIEERALINHKTKEFIDRHEKDFKSLVKLSDHRYKAVKSGNDVGFIISKQKKNLNRLAYSCAKDEIYRADDLIKDLDKLNKTKQGNTNVTEMRLQIMDMKGYLNKLKYSKIFKKAEYLTSEKIEISPNEVLQHLNGDLKILDKEFDAYDKHLKERMLKSTFQGNSKGEIKNKGFQDIFSNNYNALNLKTTQQTKVRLSKKNDKFNHNKLVKMIEQKKIDDQNLIKVKGKSIFEDPEVKRFSESQSNFERGSTMNYVKNEVHNSIHRKSILLEKRERISAGINENLIPPIETYDNLVKKYLTAKNLINKTKQNDDNLNSNDLNNKKKNLKLIENERNKFFNEIAKMKKLPQTFVDEYTKREDFNQKNQEINKVVGGNKKLDLKKMNRTIEDYFTKSSTLFLTSALAIPNKRKTKSQDAHDQMSTNMNDPRYSIEYLEPKQMNIFAKTMIKNERIGPSLDQSAYNENYKTFLKWKEEWGQSGPTKKPMRNSKSVDYIPDSKGLKIDEGRGEYQNEYGNSGAPLPILNHDTDRILETLSNIINSNRKTFRLNQLKEGGETEIPLIKKRNLKNTFYNFERKIGGIKL